MCQLKFFQPKKKKKRYLLRLLLKVYNFGISRSSRVRAFHNLGEVTWKDLSPSVTLVLYVDDASIFNNAFYFVSTIPWSFLHVSLPF